MPDRGRHRRSRYDEFSEPSNYDRDDRDNYNDRHHSRSKSLGREAVDRLRAAIGLGRDNSHSDRQRMHSLDRNYYSPRDSYRRRERYSVSPSASYYSERTSYDSDSRDDQRWKRAAEAAIDAATVEAFRLRQEPGSWFGARGARVATVALSAAAIDAIIDKDPRKHGKRKLAESTIGGLVVNRLLNGPRRALRRR